jgi:DNA-3-methyladenine glycosylase II
VTPTDYEKARRHLMRRDKTLGSVIKKVGPCKLADIPDTPPFVALAEAIASQQLSVKAADTIFKRFCDLFEPDRVPDPVRFLALDDEVVRRAGFSRAKVAFLRDLASHVVDERLPLHRLHDENDQTVLEQLVAVKGIGIWTAEIFLMFRLKRPDIFPADDLGLVKAAERIYGLRQRPDRTRLLKMAETWRPYRSVAAWYLWRSRSLSLPGNGANPARTPKRRVAIVRSTRRSTSKKPSA